MSEEVKPEVQEQPEVSDTVAYDTYKKAVAEKKVKDKQLQEMQLKLRQYEQEKLEAEGKKDDVIKSLKMERDRFESQLKEKEQKFVKSVVESQIKSVASEHGCKNLDAFLKLLDKEKLGSLEISDDFQVNKASLTNLIEESKKQYADLGLFGKKEFKVHDVTKNPTQPPATQAELLAKCKTPQEVANLIKSLT
jgi:hypothetical protein